MMLKPFDVFCLILQDTSDPLSDHVNGTYLTEMARNGTWADAVAVQATARLMKREIWIVTSTEQSAEHGWLINKIESESENSTPFLLGHLGENHYCSVGKSFEKSLSDLTHKKKKQSKTKQNQFDVPV